MTQVIAIHGGTTFENYDDYLRYLATKPLYPERMTFKPLWRERLQEDLGAEYQVLLPSMPNKTNARYSEWKLFFTHLAEIIEDDCVLIGHSMGAIFLAKYLSEEHFPRRIRKTILIAGPFDDTIQEDLTDFKLSEISDLFKQQAGDTTLFFGMDDPAVPLSEMDKYRTFIPDATYLTLPAPDHFMRESLPELIETITK